MEQLVTILDGEVGSLLTGMTLGENQKCFGIVLLKYMKRNYPGGGGSLSTFPIEEDSLLSMLF